MAADEVSPQAYAPILSSGTVIHVCTYMYNAIYAKIYLNICSITSLILVVKFAI